MAKQLYAKIERTTGEILKYRQKDNPSRALNKPTVWLPVVDPGEPAFDSKTQRVVKSVIVPDLSDLTKPVPPAARVVIQYQIVALTPGEVSAKDEEEKRSWLEDNIVQVLIDKGVISLADAQV